MKYFVRFFVITLLCFVCTYSFAEQKIVYLDMKFILNKSKAGMGAQKFMQDYMKKNQEEFIKIEENLKKEEKDLLSKKTILSKEEYKKNTDSLRKKVIDYQTQRRVSIEKITKQRAEARQKLINELNPILKEYMEENEVSIVLDNKIVVMGNKIFDITDAIVGKLNTKLPSLNLK